LPIAAIAAACGFSGQSHLNAVFKRMTGVTPGKYRKG
jgi:AraC family transcriptional regulator